MDILVKLYNRPYYLERCLHSLEMQLENVEAASAVVFLFGNDFWLTRPVSIAEVEALMQKENLLLLKKPTGGRINC